MTSSLSDSQLRKDFRDACQAQPELHPLTAVLDLYEADHLTNINLFTLLWHFTQTNSELKASYAQKVDKEMDDVARVFVQNNPVTLPETHHSLGEALRNFVAKLDGLHLHSPSSTPPSARSSPPSAAKPSGHSDYLKTGRIYAPEGASWADKLDKRFSFIYDDFVRLFKSESDGFSQVLEGDGKPMKHVSRLPFQNWGLTVSNVPADTFAARTRKGVQNLILWARQPSVNRKVRCCGFRHTWTDLYSKNNEILVMLLPLEISKDLHVWDWNGDPTSDLQGIEVFQNDKGDGLAKIAAGTTNDQFREFCLANKKWAIPFNVIMVEITFGGSNAPICHGSGLKTSTLSDLVAAVEYVDAHGNIQVVSDANQLRAAAGCFGLLGVVVSVTLRLEKMTMAVMQPVKQHIALAIPPPPGYAVPKQIDMAGITRAQLEQATKDFITRVETNDYLEWFWFPYQQKVWTNTWTKSAVTTQSLEPYPSSFQAALQWLEGYLGQLITNWWAFQRLSPRLQAWFLGAVTMFQMPDVPHAADSIKTYTSEAIHFRRGIQNMRVRDTEWEIPFPAVAGGTSRDYSVLQRAWWDSITAFYSSESPAMRLTLELRITGSSNIILAPQRGNDLGTISIEALTPMNTAPADWESFVQQLADLWTSYRADGGRGELLNVRPHWAKEWQGTVVRGLPVLEYLKKVAYKEQIPEFVDVLGKVAEAKGSSLVQSRERFTNPLLESLLFS